MKLIFKRLLPLILPVSFIIGASILYVKIDALPDSAQNLVLYFSYVLLAAVIILSFMFNRSRVFFIALVIFISEILLIVCKTSNGIESFNPTAVRSIISIILPIDIGIVANSSDKGILSSSGKYRLTVLFFEYLFIGWVIISNRISIIRFINSVPLHIGNLTPVPLSILLLFCCTFIFFIAKIIIMDLAKDRLLFGVLISVFIGLFSGNTNVSVSVFFSASGILLLICALYETYFLAYMDELTGLPSRRALKENMLKLKGKYSIAMMDIDYFKKFNDNYGHDSGDEVLRFIGKCLRQIPGGGKSYRYGGEEFTVIFPGKNAAEVIPYMEKLREHISRSPIPLVKKKSSAKQWIKKVSVTISGGVAERNERHPYPNDVLKAADTALYRAKDKGRNCICR